MMLTYNLTARCAGLRKAVSLPWLPMASPLLALRSRDGIYEPGRRLADIKWFSVARRPQWIIKDSTPSSMVRTRVQGSDVSSLMRYTSSMYRAQLPQEFRHTQGKPGSQCRSYSSRWPHDYSRFRSRDRRRDPVTVGVLQEHLSFRAARLREDVIFHETKYNVSGYKWNIMEDII
ncbi:hypothetical protein FIBSPDRAFT_1016035 [Athelia psychrophila]|uniref:Uncharacterized protein n=1 Tax=Athelia psychrophila TaxID=1759441 RepID=A0A166LKT5_9AGAM|nr:hypothetical protein FIBSPDRAFT_1016035 [Fibularhizoctonia sp. CBS 109695]